MRLRHSQITLKCFSQNTSKESENTVTKGLSGNGVTTGRVGFRAVALLSNP